MHSNYAILIDYASGVDESDLLTPATKFLDGKGDENNYYSFQWGIACDGQTFGIADDSTHLVNFEDTVAEWVAIPLVDAGFEEASPVLGSNAAARKLMATIRTPRALIDHVCRPEVFEKEIANVGEIPDVMTAWRLRRKLDTILKILQTHGYGGFAPYLYGEEADGLYGHRCYDVRKNQRATLDATAIVFFDVHT